MESWCASSQVPIFRINPDFIKLIELNERNDGIIVDTLWQVKAFMYAHRKSVKELVKFLEASYVDESLENTTFSSELHSRNKRNPSCWSRTESQIDLKCLLNIPSKVTPLTSNILDLHSKETSNINEKSSSIKSTSKKMELKKMKLPKSSKTTSSQSKTDISKKTVYMEASSSKQRFK